MISSVVTTDGSPYLDWQVRLLRFSHDRVRQPGRLDVVERTVEVAGDDYPPYNRPAGLGEWADALAPKTTAVVLDPDMVFLRRLDTAATAGALLAHDGSYPVPARQRQVLRRYARAPEALPIPIVPLVLTAGDLARMATPWLEYTKELRADPAARAELGWLCEMWACALAAREAGVRCRVAQIASIPPLPHPRRAALGHYAWVTACFDKRTYRPWSDVRRCRHRVHARMRTLVRGVRATASGRAA
ncbi:MAG TPA: hypothetical protein VGW75_09380 [Solirubrobacteraceae bacterium]|nr:hypothetical protein [Solirubrobacteraceae bacterium]